MENKRTRWGVGPKWVVLSLLYSVCAILANKFLLDDMKIPFIPKNVLLITGMILMSIGGIICIKSIIDFNVAYTENKLVTTGFYGLVRHPLYSSFIILIVPGSVLVTGNILGLTVPVAMYIIFRFLIPEEEKNLIEVFGDEYTGYKKRVNAVFPKIC